MIIIVSKAAPPEHSGAGKRMFAFFHFLRSKGYNVKYVTNTQINDSDIIVIKRHYLERHLGKFNPFVTFIYTFGQLFYRSISGSFSSINTPRTVWLVSASPLTSAAGIFFYMHGYRVITQNVLVNSDDPSHRPPGPLKITYRLKKLQYRYSHVVTSISPALYDLSKAYHHNCIMIPNPVEIPRLIKPVKQDKKTNILVVGRLCYRKGTDIVFKTINMIHSSDPSVIFTFIGPYNDDEEELNNLYNNCYKINKENVIFEGYQIDPRPWYKKADILFLPSRREGFGTVFIEAMAYGLPVVAKKIPGITDYIFDNGYPAIIDSENPNEYENIILKLINDNKYYEALVEELRLKVKRFDMDYIYNQYINTIKAT